MSDCEPYLSVVVTARNDDHGGSLLRRMQTFLNSWIGQAKRHGLCSELIVVEWNPPPERPPLREALAWPADLGSCTVRFIEVPREVHLRYRHAEHLPLYQMIAKNVGIRRASGPFVLVTNIDILFSDELVSYLASGCLEKNRMYRVDRLDISSEVPVDGTVDEQLRYCESHFIRCNARNGTFTLTPDGRRALETFDIAVPGCDVSFGTGWFPPERDGSVGTYRWLDNDAEVTVRRSAGASEPLIFVLEPGPSAGIQPLSLEVVDSTGKVLAESLITRRSEVSVLLPPRADAFASFHFRLVGGGLPVLHDPRTLNLRVLRCGWKSLIRIAPPGAEAQYQGPWVTLMRALDSLARTGFVNIALQDQSLLRRMIQSYVNEGGLSGAVKRRMHRPLASERRASASMELSSDATNGTGVRYTGAWANLMHVLDCLSQDGSAAIVLPPDSKLRRMIKSYVYAGGLTGAVKRRIRGGMLEEPQAPAPQVSAPAVEENERPAFLHTNGCGDFTLMAREHWFDLRGYPEFDLFSMNLDSVLCHSAHHAGFREEVLQDPLRIYHIEHGTGSGWTPEGQAQLYERLRARGIPWLDYSQFVSLAEQMRRFDAPLIFNQENWGLADVEFKETIMSTKSVAAPFGYQ